MKSSQKRVWAILSALMMLISILGGIVVLPVQAATVNYVYSGKYVYNWGERNELATYLSPMAEDFYADNAVTYQQLASLSGSSSTSDVPYSSLFGELHELMYDNLDAPTSYDATRELFRYTDCENNGGAISSFYSGKEIGPSWDSGKTWNREHTWPNSKSNSKSDGNTQRETDIMMLRPASVSENSDRSNTAYGESSKYYHPNSESGGQYDLRGDVSRIVLYVYTCWGGSDKHDGALDYMWGSSGVIESKSVLLKWMEEDPVDTWELGRNDSVESITGTRNVFVDYPELAFRLFDEDVPAGYDSPSGEGATAGYTITASTNNSNYGTVSLSGNVITATPKTGYAASGYTILSGAATVTRNGNKFTVSPTSDVSVRINFAKRDELTVRFVQAGAVTQSVTAYAGDAIVMPAHSGAVPSGQTFLGWCSNEVAETTTEPTYYPAGSTQYVNTATTFYALYARSEEGGVINNNTYEPYSGAITEGDYIIVYQGGALVAEIGSAGRFNYAEISTASGSIKDPAANIVWHIAASGNTWTLYNAASGSYAAGDGTKNKGTLITTLTDYGKWTVTGDGAYEFVNVGNKNKSVNANLRRNGTYGYACYSTSTGGALTLYKRVSGTVYYFTADAVPCTHTYSNACDDTCNVCGAKRTPAAHVYTSRITTAATCGKNGVRTYTCSVCSDSYTEVIPATGAHTYDNACDADCNGCGTTRTPAAHVYTSRITTAATCGKDGVRTYTCSVCGDSYTEAIPATGAHTYDNACDADCNACGAVRTPSDHVYTADCDAICNVCGDERTATASGEMTITFDADKTQRVEFSSAAQVWQNGDLTVTNNKGSGSSNVADYSNPVRFYKGSQIIIAYPGMTSLVISAPTDSYGTPWAATLDAAGLLYTVDGGVYTVTIAQPVDSITLTASAQIRANSITAIAVGAVAEHEYDNDCDATCNHCGAVREVAGHTYANDYDTDCDSCGAIREILYRVFSAEVENSAMEMSSGVGGLAFKFDALVSGADRTNRNESILTNATINYRGVECKVIALGAVVTNKAAIGTSYDLMVREQVNGKITMADINAKYLMDCNVDVCSFAVRIINIPQTNYDTLIFARPYCVLEYEGEEITVYDDIASATYAASFITE